MNKGFKIAVENLEKITNSTKRILKKVDKILEYIIDSPQVIILVAVAGIVSMSAILGVLIGVHIIKLIKTMKHENGDNAKLIKDLFSKR